MMRDITIPVETVRLALAREIGIQLALGEIAGGKKIGRTTNEFAAAVRRKKTDRHVNAEVISRGEREGIRLDSPEVQVARISALTQYAATVYFDVSATLGTGRIVKIMREFSSDSNLLKNAFEKTVIESYGYALEVAMDKIDKCQIQAITKFLKKIARLSKVTLIEMNGEQRSRFHEIKQLAINKYAEERIAACERMLSEAQADGRGSIISGAKASVRVEVRRPFEYIKYCQELYGGMKVPIEIARKIASLAERSAPGAGLD